MKSVLPGITSLLMILVLLAGCATRHPPVLITADRHPLKIVPKNNRIPTTQKPYTIKGKTYYPLPSARGFEETGLASWYGPDFHGRKTSNGETYNMYGTTAAHKTLPMSTMLLVTNLDNGREMTVRVNDRGPFHKGRVVDLTKTGAEKLGFSEQGTAKVRITALGEATSYRQGGVEINRFKEYPDLRHGDYFVQIGSFGDENNAKRLSESMVAAGRQSVVEKFDHDDRIFFRVQIGAGNDLTAAKLVETELNGAGFADTFVVAR